MLASHDGGVIHFRHYFHPAGHGTFFSGHIKCSEGSDHDDFVWVYDCGSRRWTQLDRLIAPLAARLAPRNFVDMVCISHFDSDHVHGIEALINKVRVGVLVLPYLSLEARLGLACQLAGSEPSAHRLAAMIADPSRYFAERGLRDRVERIILVQGGPPPDSDGLTTPDVEPRSPDKQRGGDDCDQGIHVTTRPLSTNEVGHQMGAWIEVAGHDQPWNLGGLYELMFYNRALPGEVAPQSGASVSDVAAEAGEVITKHGLCATAAPMTGWVKELRRVYSHHFGGLPKERNEISLCALGRPQVKGDIRLCQKYRTTFPYPHYQIPCTANHSQPAVLLSGDISFDSSELAELERHVGPARWGAVGVMQVPHHGSAHSWKLGLSAACVHHHSVICAAPSVHHPHPMVVLDLRGRNPVTATYSQAVTFDYHIHLKK